MSHEEQRKLLPYSDWIISKPSGALVAVRVVWLRPVGKRIHRPVFFPTFWEHVEECVDPEELLSAATKRTVCVEDFPLLVLVEHAISRKIGRPLRVELREVINGVARRDLFGPERYVEIIVEVRLIRRDPIEVPIHLLAYHFDLIERGTGYRHIRHVVMRKMFQ